MATLKDVAREAGLTVSTVSRVLNNRGYISADARLRVSEAMKKLNYRPNELARSLQNKTSMNIGVIVPHIRHPYFAEMIHELEEAAYRKGYRIILCNSQGKEEREKEYVEMCSANRVAGIILCAGGVSAEPFEMLNIPILAIERPVEHCNASIDCDNMQGGTLATECLVKAGCKNLVYIGSVMDIAMPADVRSEAFLNVCEANGVKGHIFHTGIGMYNNMDYDDLILEMLDKHPEIDGIFAGSDIIGAQVLQACRKKKLSVPEDIRVVGFDDVLLAGFTSPRLTSVHQPIHEMAETAIRILLDIINGADYPRNTRFPVYLVERESTDNKMP